MKNNKEIWKDIQGYEGLYQVSNLGRIKSGYKSIILQPGVCRGYLIVNLYKDKKGLSQKVHRLVAQAFIPNPENKPTVNHKDGNKQNNCVSNLEWATIKEQNNHALKLGLMENAKKIRAKNMKNITIKYLKKRSEKLKKPVNQYDLNGKFIKMYSSAFEACKINNFNNPSNIRNCCQGTTDTAYGYKWNYYQEKYMKGEGNNKCINN